MIKLTDEIYETIESLVDEKEINGRYQCKICYNNNIDKFIKNCGHTFCGRCITNVTKCPVCNGEFDDICDLYFQ